MTPAEAQTEFVPEPYTSDHLATLERWQHHECVGLAAMTRFRLCDTLGNDPDEYGKQEDAEAFCGDIEPARCLPMGCRLYHSDMGWLCEAWTILDPIPAVCARIGDTLYHCPEGPGGRRDGRGDAWPTEWAIMYRDDSTYVAFLTDEHVKALYFPADDEVAP